MGIPVYYIRKHAHNTERYKFKKAGSESNLCLYIFPPFRQTIPFYILHGANTYLHIPVRVSECATSLHCCCLLWCTTAHAQENAFIIMIRLRNRARAPTPVRREPISISHFLLITLGRNKLQFLQITISFTCTREPGSRHRRAADPIPPNSCISSSCLSGCCCGGARSAEQEREERRETRER